MKKLAIGVGYALLLLISAVVGLAVWMTHPLFAVASTVIFCATGFAIFVVAQRSAAREAAAERRHREIMAALGHPLPEKRAGLLVPWGLSKEDAS